MDRTTKKEMVFVAGSAIAPKLIGAASHGQAGRPGNAEHLPAADDGVAQPSASIRGTHGRLRQNRTRSHNEFD